MRKALTIIIIFLTIGLTIFFQANLLEVIPLKGTSANLGIVLVASLGLICGKLVGGLTGAIYGLIYDILFGRAVGIYLGAYFLIGVVSGALNKNFSKDNKVSMIFLISILTAIFEIGIYLLFVLLRSFEFDLLGLAFIVGKEIVYNILLVIILYKFLIWFGEMINKSKDSYYLI